MNYYQQTKIIATVFIFLTLSISNLFAQTFSEQTGIALTGVSGHSEAWGDYNNDGYLDLLVAGNDGSSSIVKLYFNNGDNTFTWQSTVTFAVNTVYDIAWGDYDNDGDLDILIASTFNSKLYENKGDGTFVLKATLPEVFGGKCLWADLDNDGYKDIILIGSGGTKLLKNNQDGTFTAQTNTMPAVSNYSAVACGDYDKDGDLDILLAGLNSSTEITKVFRNDGNFTFAEQTGIVLPGIANCAVAWADIDNDGDLDIILSGSAVAFTNKIYENKGSNTFAELAGTTFQDLYQSSMDIADYDNDGYKDIIIAGSYNGSDYYTNIYHNNKNKTFTKITTETIPGVQFGTIKFGDYDNDGKLDLFICGNAITGKIAKVYKNGTTIANTAPQAPTNLYYNINPNKIILRWSDATDLENNMYGLSYNVYIYRLCSTKYIYSPQAFRQSDAKNGRRFIAQSACIQRTSGGGRDTITGLPDGNYKWSVQAVDAGLKGGNFAAEGSFVVADNNIYSKQTGIELDSVGYSSVAWGDYNNDGYQDLLLTGMHMDSNTPFSKIYKNNGDGSFSWQDGIALTGVYRGSVAWGDYNNDNYLDILLTGSTDKGPISKLYKNNGNGTFSEQTGTALPNVAESAVAWCDYNNDGYQDILLTGNSNNVGISKLFKNNRDGSFSEQTDIVFPGISYGSVAWGDFNNDGFSDLLLSGSTANNNLIASLYKNNGDDTFTQLGLSLPGSMYSAVAWGDYNNDGFLDIALSGRNDVSSSKCAIYKNNGDETFTKQTQIWMFNNDNGTLTWGDYNNDGYLDLLNTGSIGTFLYRNTGENDFTFLDESLPFAECGSPNVAFSDYDNDGKLDVIFTGLSSTLNKSIGNVFRNIGNYVSNNRPSAPTNLIQTVSANSVKLTWDKASDNETPQNGLSYNIYVKNIDNNKFVKSPRSVMEGVAKGRSLIYQAGEIQKGLSLYTLKNLPSGNYKWSVQSLDGINAGSDFAPESSFSIVLGSDINVNVKENMLTNTSANIEYSINSTNGTNGTWQVCTMPNTIIDYGSGGFDVWIRQASDIANTLKVATIAVQVSAPIYNIDYVNETTDKIVPSTDEYSTISSMSLVTSGTNTKIMVTPGQNLYFRTKATINKVASSIQPLTLPERPTLPAFSIDYAVEKTSQVIPSTVEYSTSSLMSVATSGIDLAIALIPGQSLYFRTKATTTAFKSNIQTLTSPTRPVAPAFAIDYINETTSQTISSGYEYSTNLDMSNANAGLNAKIPIEPGQNLYFRAKATASAFKSNIQTLTVPIRPATPSNLVINDIANTFDWTYTPGYSIVGLHEYSANNGSTWTVCTTKPTNVGNVNIAAGALQLRLAATSSMFKSNALVSTSDFSLNTGITNLDEAGIKMYPNPVSDILIIDGLKEQSKITISDIHGKLIKTLDIQNHTERIDINYLPQGMYILKIENSSIIAESKFIKQ